MDTPRIAVIVIDVFVALTAVGGGIALVAKTDWFPLQWLEGTPFRSFLIPGLILAAFVGGSAAVATIAAILDSDAGALTSIVAGVIMMGWIAGQLHLLKQQSWLHAVYFAAGLAMVALGVVLWFAD
jgi:hypothetical protein